MTARYSVLVVDDDPGVVEYLHEALSTRGFDVVGATAADHAIDLIRRASFDVVLTDVEMPRMRGTELLAAILALKPRQLVVVMTAFGSIDLAVTTMRNGAADFVTKPFTISTLTSVIERALTERGRVPRLEREAPVASDLVAVSERMQQVLRQATRAARGTASILITGETGTGKSALARFIHGESSRSTGPFVQLNSAALPSALVESELFGVRRGAYTDAREDRPGMFVAASNGTLFLDEIGELPLGAQAKLLHALEANVVRPVGAVDDVKVDARVIAATNRSVEDLVQGAQFRADLYYRLNVLRIAMPPLRDRRDDIPALVDVAIRRAIVRYERPQMTVSPRAMGALATHNWPGNIRELLNVVERAVALSDDEIIDLDALRFDESPRDDSDALGPLEKVELEHVQRTLEYHRGNVSAAARALGINRRTLYRKLEKLAGTANNDDE